MSETIDVVATEIKPVKLTKVQKEFFHGFAFNAVSTLLVGVHDMNGSDVPLEDLYAQVQSTDLSELVQEIGEHFLARVPFKSLQKVDKFLKSDEAVSVVVASTEVSNAINGSMLEIITRLVQKPE